MTRRQKINKQSSLHKELADFLHAGLVARGMPVQWGVFVTTSLKPSIRCIVTRPKEYPKKTTLYIAVTPLWKQRVMDEGVAFGALRDSDVVFICLGRGEPMPNPHFDLLATAEIVPIRIPFRGKIASFKSSDTLIGKIGGRTVTGNDSVEMYQRAFNNIATEILGPAGCGCGQVPSKTTYTIH